MEVINSPSNKYFFHNDFSSTHYFPGDFRLPFLNCRDLVGKLDIFGLCEKFLNSTTKALVNLHGYKLVCKNRQNNKQGRLGLFVKSSLTVKIISDVEHLKLEMLFEILAVEIEVNHEPTVYYVRYRLPSGSAKRYTEILQDFIDILSRKYSKSIIMVDFNVGISLLRNRSTSNLHTSDVAS